MKKKHNIVKAEEYLYILSDDEIKEGDWAYHEVTKNVIQSYQDGSLYGNWKKIIATNDPNLTKVNEVSGDNVWTSPIPEIPQSLVEHYAKHQPEEVELEYEVYKELTRITMTPYNAGTRLKLQDNEVVWVEPEIEKFKNAYNKANNLYTREEVDKLIVKGIKDFAEMNPLLRGCQVTDFEIEEWRKENL